MRLLQQNNAIEMGFVQQNDATQMGFIQQNNATEIGFIQQNNVTEMGFVQQNNDTHMGFIQQNNVSDMSFIQFWYQFTIPFLPGITQYMEVIHWINTYIEFNTVCGINKGHIIPLKWVNQWLSLTAFHGHRTWSQSNPYKPGTIKSLI